MMTTGYNVINITYTPVIGKDLRGTMYGAKPKRGINQIDLEQLMDNLPDSMVVERFDLHKCCKPLPNTNISLPNASVIVIRRFLQTENNFVPPLSDEFVYGENFTCNMDWIKWPYQSADSVSLDRTLHFADIEQKYDPQTERHRIRNMQTFPEVDRVREAISDMLFAAGTQVGTLHAEVIRYLKNCGFSEYHKATSNVTVGVRLGNVSFPLQFRAFENGKPVSTHTGIKLNPGDVYVMCETASGHNHNRNDTVVYLHAAGTDALAAILDEEQFRETYAFSMTETVQNERRLQKETNMADEDVSDCGLDPDEQAEYIEVMSRVLAEDDAEKQEAPQPVRNHLVMACELVEQTIMRYSGEQDPSLDEQLADAREFMATLLVNKDDFDAPEFHATDGGQQLSFDILLMLATRFQKKVREEAAAAEATRNTAAEEK